MGDTNLNGQEKSAPHHCPPPARKYVLAAAVLASALGFIDGSVVSIAIPKIRMSLEASFAQSQWVHNAYILFLSAFILIGGAAGDRFGIRRTFAFGIILFVAASQLCALAWSPVSLIAFRVLQGLGAAIMVPGSMSIIARNFPRGERGKALGIWVAASSITTAMGPLFGGALLSQASGEVWRFIFAVNLPLGGLALFLLWAKVPDDAPRKNQSLDLMGAVLVTLALGAIAVGLTLYGEGHGFGVSLGIFCLGFVLLALAWWWEKRTPHAMIDLELFRSATFTGGNVFTFVVWMGLGTIFFFLPMVLVVGWHLNELYAGAVFMPFAMIIAVFSPFVGRYVDQIGPRPFLTIGALFSAGSYALMGWAMFTQSYWMGVFPSMILLGVSMALCASPISVAVLGAVKDEKSGSASGINNMVARLSGMIGVAALGILISYVYTTVIEGSTLPPEIQALMLNAGYGERLSGGLYQVTTQAVHSDAMNMALASVAAALCGLSLLGSMIAWLTIAPIDKSEELK